MKPNNTQEELRSIPNVVLSWLTGLPITTTELSDVSNQEWQKLYRQLETTMKLEVRSVLDRLEKEFTEAEDWWASNIAPKLIEAERRKYE